MRKLISVISIVLVLFSLTSTVHAGGAVKKLGRGIANVGTSPFELFKGMGDATKENGIFAGLTWGIIRGTINTIKRAAVGVYEVGTFPAPIPKNYEPILNDPEFFLGTMFNEKDKSHDNGLVEIMR